MSRLCGGLEHESRTALAVVAAAISMLLVPAAAGAAPWTQAQLPGAAGKVFLLGASCPSSSLCVAVGTDNLIASSTNPTGGNAAWKVVYAGEGPWPYIPASNEFISGRQIQAVSCPSLQLCVAVTDQGNIYTSTDPTGPASSWAVTEIDDKGRNTHLYGVSCPTVSLCVAVSGKRADKGKIFTSTDPTAGASAWHSIEFAEPFRFRAVSCGSPQLCVTVTDDGQILASSEPTGNASAWKVIGAPAGPSSLQAVSCVAAPLCVSGNHGGDLFSTTDPTGPLSSWSSADGGGSVQITGVSCPSASQCLAVDDNGDVLTSTDPTGGSSSWSFTNLMPFTEAEGNALFAASCPSASLCALTGARGQIFTNTAPFAKASAAAQPGRAHRLRRPRAKVASVHLPPHQRLEGHRAKMTIRFYARGGVGRYVCKFDRAPFRRCRSPISYDVTVRRRLTRHLFAVRAIGVTGLKGPITRERITIYPLCNSGFQRARADTRSAAVSPRPHHGKICY